jgi:ADP-ribose pyrophosphatase YjhB (NUDIX family)
MCRSGRSPRGEALITVVAAAIIEHGRLLVVSKKAAPGVFYLPGGKPEPGEDERATLLRELDEELGVRPHGLARLADFRGIAALEQAPMLMTVFTAALAERPRPAAELARLAWTDGADGYAARLAPAVRDQVIPHLRASGQMPAR